MHGFQTDAPGQQTIRKIREKRRPDGRPRVWVPPDASSRCGTPKAFPWANWAPSSGASPGRSRSLSAAFAPAWPSASARSSPRRRRHDRESAGHRGARPPLLRRHAGPGRGGDAQPFDRERSGSGEHSRRTGAAARPALALVPRTVENGQALAAHSRQTDRGGHFNALGVRRGGGPAHRGGRGALSPRARTPAVGGIGGVLRRNHRGARRSIRSRPLGAGGRLGRIHPDGHGRTGVTTALGGAHGVACARKRARDDRRIRIGERISRDRSTSSPTTAIARPTRSRPPRCTTRRTSISRSSGATRRRCRIWSTPRSRSGRAGRATACSCA
jgi:hypothetical protein